MQGGFNPNQQGPFEPNPNMLYKIVTVMDQKKCFSLKKQGKNPVLKLDDYKAKEHQLFHIYSNNGRYAIVQNEAALHVLNDKQDDGAVIASDASQHLSSYFELVPVTQGQWAGQSYYLRTFCGKTFDLTGSKLAAGTDIKQLKYAGGPNQMWMISIADQPQKKEPPKPHHKKDEVPPHFTPALNTIYRISLTAAPGKALTINTQGEPRAYLSDYVGTPNQQFSVTADKKKFAFVNQATNCALCVYMNSNDDCAKIFTDGGKHTSSWFEVERCNKGQFANKGYILKTHAKNKAVDVDGGQIQNNGADILQYQVHHGQNQVWLIVNKDESPPNDSTYGGFNFNLPNVGQAMNAWGGQGGWK